MKSRKIIIKEFDRKLLGIDIMLYFIFAVIGFALLNLAETTQLDTINYVPSIFYILGFFSLIAYFGNRKRNDYEFLAFGFINICTATFILVNQDYGNDGIILADAILFYTVANLLNKCYTANNLIKERNLNYFPKISIAIILSLLGMFISFELFYKASVSSTLIAYFLVSYGLLSLIEPLIVILMRNPNIENKIMIILKYDEPIKKQKIKIKEINEKKPIVNLKDGEIKIKSKKNKMNKKTNN